MNLDVATLNWVLFLIYLVNMLLAFFLLWAGRSFQGGGLWVAALALLALGAGATVARDALPVPVSVLLVNGSFLGALLLFPHSIWLIQSHRPFPRRWYWLLLPILGSFLYAGFQPYSVRAALFSLWSGLLCLFPLVLLWRQADRPAFLAGLLTSAPFGLTAIVSLWRFFYNLWAPAHWDVATPGVGNLLFMLGSVLMAPVTLFGYFMLAWNRAEYVLRKKDEEIEARNRKLQQSSRAKDLFFSIIAHDLRGPIGGSARYVRKHLLGKMSGLEPKFTEVETLASALEKTNEFLEKLLWWSRSQLQDWVPQQTTIDLQGVFDQTQALIHSAAEMKEIRIVWPTAPFPAPIADPDSVQLILGNLVSNAVKFSLPGKVVRISVERAESLCRIVVKDEGVGMDAATLDRLFRIEDKLSSHGTVGERGSGLGLILARSLAEKNNGGVTVESRPGVGTTAVLWLPLAPVSPKG